MLEYFTTFHCVTGKTHTTMPRTLCVAWQGVKAFWVICFCGCMGCGNLFSSAEITDHRTAAKVSPETNLRQISDVEFRLKPNLT